MSAKRKLSILGGSAFATPMLFESIGKIALDSNLEVCLHGRNAERLNKVAEISKTIVEKYPLDIQIKSTLDIDECVENADLVLNQVRIGGMRGRLFDESFPRKFGIPGEETVGPGGFSNSLRTIPVVLEMCRKVESLAPKATLLNLSNPSSIVQYAIMKYTKVPVYGTCNTPLDLIAKIAGVLDISTTDLEIDWFGMHHFGWMLDIKQQGESVLNDVIKNIDKLANLGIDPEVIQAIHAIPVPYFKYYFHPDRYLAATEGRTLRAAQLISLYKEMEDLFARWETGDDIGFIKRRGAKWYDVIIAPVLKSFLEGTPSKFILSTENRGAVSWLPNEAIIEAETEIVFNGISNVVIPADIPEDFRSMVAQNCAYEMLAAEAIVENDRSKAIRALQSNLLVNNFNQIRGILAEIWPGEKRYAFKVKKKDSTNQSVEDELGFAVPTLFYGDRAIEDMHVPEKKYGVISMEVPWSLVNPRISRVPEFTAFIEELDWYMLETLERSLPQVDAIVGVGGGMATDAAKYFAWKRNIPVDVIPTITSVDASVTKSIAARAGGHVTYIGYVVPRNVFIDYKIIGGAPKRLNRSGVGDILCGHTALFDWTLSNEVTGEEFDQSAADEMQGWMNRIANNPYAVMEMSPEGIKLIMQAFEEISIICRKFGSSRPQEGADHTFAYNAEFQTGKNFLHGELVALGTYVIANFQGNKPEYLSEVYRDCGILWQPKDLDLTKEEFIRTMKTLNWYQKNFGRRYSILDQKEISGKFIQEMVNKLVF